MDCPSEERLIRMKLEGISAIQDLQFNIPERKLIVVHSENSEIESRLKSLGLGSELKEQSDIDWQSATSNDDFTEEDIIKRTEEITSQFINYLKQNSLIKQN